MPTTTDGKAIAARNATTHGLFARDVVLPALGEDPQAYHQLEQQWIQQLPPRTLLERHYVEKIAAASWRLRRLHRWQAQLFEDETLTEGERIDRLDKVLRHETALHHQIDTAVKMLNKDAPQLFARRAREQVQEDLRMFEGECRADLQDERVVALEVQNRLYRIRTATEQAANELSMAPLDTQAAGNSQSADCQNELPHTEASPSSPSLPSPCRVPPRVKSAWGGGASPAGNHVPDDEKTGENGDAQNCENEPAASPWDLRPITGHREPKQPQNAYWKRDRYGRCRHERPPSRVKPGR